MTATGSAPVRVVLVGCGGMSRAWLDPLSNTPSVQVVGLVDVRRAAAEERAKQYNLPPAVVFDSLDAALTQTAPHVVCDVTVPEAHERVTLMALRAGCHVLGEKPMSTTLASARRMAAAAAKARRLYAVIQNRRYEPNIQRVRKLITGGKIGRLEEVHADFFLGPRFGGFRDLMDYPLLVDMAIHTFDAARYLTAADPVTVYCHSFNPNRSWYKGHASAVCVFEMTGRIVYTYRGSWCARGLNTNWNSQWRLLGARGTITWDGGEDIKAQAVDPRGKRGFMDPLKDVAIPPVHLEHQGHAGLIHEFLHCVRHGGKPQTIGSDNIRSLAMVLAAVRSAKQGRKVKVRW